MFRKIFPEVVSIDELKSTNWTKVDPKADASIDPPALL
jgi:hypothetical protein